MSSQIATTTNPSGPSSLRHWVSDFRAWITLLLLGLLTVWAMIKVGPSIGAAGTKDDKTGLVSLPFDQAKEILLIIGGYVTTALGFWFGAKGTDSANQQAAAAVHEASAAHQQAAALRQTLTPDQLDDVIAKNRELFGRATS